MRIICDEQRTPEWFEAKRGRISASDAGKCLMGKHTKGYRGYVEKIADDLEGIPDFGDEDNPPWFTDGVYYESWARGWYAFKRDVDVGEIGFAVHDDYEWIGCSPDGLVGDKGMIEIKYRSFLRTFQKAAETTIRPSVNPQVQCQMLVCDRDWVDYVNYWRSADHDVEKGHIQRVHRDQSYIDNTLLPAFRRFWQSVEQEMEDRELQRQRAKVYSQ